MKITVSFYDKLPRDTNQFGLPLAPKPLATYGYAADGTSAVAPDEARFARFASDTAVHLAHGLAATTNDPYVPANSPEFFGVYEGQSLTWLTA